MNCKDFGYKALFVSYRVTWFGFVAWRALKVNLSSETSDASRTRYYLAFNDVKSLYQA